MKPVQMTDPFWTAVMGVSFIGYLVSLVALIWRGFDKNGRLQRKPALVFAILATLFFLLWLQGLDRA